MKITTARLDLARNLFQAHGIDEPGNVALQKQPRRHPVLEFFCEPASVPARHEA